MTTMARTRETSKITELKPSSRPTEVARPTTSAVCELGMPPVVTRVRTSMRRSRMSNVTNLMS
ncbi:hypothetical protein D3C78_1887100 [compost metagenome]